MSDGFTPFDGDFTPLSIGSYPMRVTPEEQADRDKRAADLRATYEPGGDTTGIDARVTKVSTGREPKFAPYSGEFTPVEQAPKTSFEPYTGDFVPLKDAQAPNDFRGEQALPQEDYGDQVSRGVANQRLAKVPDTVDKLWQGTKDATDVVAIPEFATHVVSSFTTGFAAGIGGAIGEAAKGFGKLTAGADAGDTFTNMRDRFAELSDAATYSPRSEAGKRLAAGWSEVMGSIAKASDQYIGEPLTDWAMKHQGETFMIGPAVIAVPSPEVVGAVASASTQMIVMMAGFKAVGKAMPEGKPAPEITPSAATERTFQWNLVRALGDAQADPAQRYGAAMATAERLNAQGRVGPEAARAWLDNAAEAIGEGRPVDMSEDAFRRPGDIEGQSMRGAPEGTPQLPPPVPELGAEADIAQRALPSPETVSRPPGSDIPPELPTSADRLQASVAQENAVGAADTRAGGVDAARAAVDAQRTAFEQAISKPVATASAGEPTASKIAIDPANPMASIEAIAKAPITPIDTLGPAPGGIDASAHGAAAGDLAGALLHIEQLGRELKLAKPEHRAVMKAEIERLKAESQGQLTAYGQTHGPDAQSHLHVLASRVYQGLKGNYRGFVKRPGVIPGTTVPEATDALEVNAAGPLGPQQGGIEGAGGQVQGGGVGLGNAEGIAGGNQGLQAAPAPAGAGEGGGERSLGQLPADQVALPPQNEAQQAKPATVAQVKAGNAALDHRPLGPFNISIENRAGSVRRDIHNEPPTWESKMHADYGYAKGTEGNDGEHIDFFTEPGTPNDYNGKVFVIDQKNAEGGFDEHKVMVGPRWQTEAQAKAAYLKHYPKGWDRVLGITETTLGELHSWQKLGNTKMPFADHEPAAEPEAPKYEKPTVKKTIKLTDGTEATIHMKSEHAISDIEGRISAVEKLLECL